MNQQPLPVVAPHDIQGGAPVVQAANPLDLPTEHFKAGLDRRRENRASLMEWVRAALVEGVDYGRIHVVSKHKCRLGNQCQNPAHWSKPSLFKPGAEKICGMLGVTVSYPTLSDYEQAALTGTKIENVIIRCELLDGSGRVVADGVGARSLSQDYGDLNKALKMAEKSAHIDATLRMAGLSEVFTQDIEDMLPAAAAQPTGKECPPGKGELLGASGTASSAQQQPPAGNQRPPTAGSSSGSAPPVRQNGASQCPPLPERPSFPPSVSVITEAQHKRLEARIAELGLDRERVKSWMVRASRGSVTHFGGLSQALYKKLYDQLEGWAERAAIQQESTKQD